MMLGCCLHLYIYGFHLCQKLRINKTNICIFITPIIIDYLATQHTAQMDSKLFVVFPLKVLLHTTILCGMLHDMIRMLRSMVSMLPGTIKKLCGMFRMLSIMIRKLCDMFRMLLSMIRMLGGVRGGCFLLHSRE